MLRLKICDSHLTCKVANKCLNVCEWVEVVGLNKRRSPPCPCCLVESSLVVKKNLVEKKLSLFCLQIQFALQACLSLTCWHLLLYKFNIIWVDRYLCVLPVNQLRKQLGVTFYCNSWCYTLSVFGVLSKKNKLALNIVSKLLNIKSLPLIK